MVRRFTIAIAVLSILVLSASVAVAQSGHFLTGGRNAPTCTFGALTVECSGKVAGLGGTTFEIRVVADGIANVDCTNPGGNVAPGQRTAVSVDGSTGTLNTPRNGQYRFDVGTAPPAQPPATPTCPNAQWSASITSIDWTSATLYLYEGGHLSDTSGPIYP